MSLLGSLLGNASEVSVQSVQAEFEPVLVDGERVEQAYKLIRDMFVFTNKRLIMVDKQGLTGSKSEFKSIPYSSIKVFSKESAGLLDLDAELKIWLHGGELILKTFNRSVDINQVYKTLSTYVLH